jgi:hypothetical protein
VTAKQLATGGAGGRREPRVGAAPDIDAASSGTPRIAPGAASAALAIQRGAPRQARRECDDYWVSSPPIPLPGTNVCTTSSGTDVSAGQSGFPLGTGTGGVPLLELKWYRHKPRSGRVSIPPVPPVPENSDLTCACRCVCGNRPTTARSSLTRLQDPTRTVSCNHPRHRSPSEGFQIGGTSGTSVSKWWLTREKWRTTRNSAVVPADRVGVPPAPVYRGQPPVRGCTRDSGTPRKSGRPRPKARAPDETGGLIRGEPAGSRRLGCCPSLILQTKSSPEMMTVIPCVVGTVTGSSVW